MKKILVAYDGSPGAELAVKDMVRGGFPERAEAKVVTIADVWLPPEFASEGYVPDRTNLAAAHEKAAEVLHEARKTAIQGARLLHGIFPDWTVSNTAKADSPAWGIMAEAKRWHADLIVIGTHGRTPLERFFLGSVSYKVAAEAECSVRLERPRPRPTHEPANILIGMDGSEDGRRAVDEVLGRRWGNRTEVHLVTVIDLKLKSTILRKLEIPGTTGPVNRIEDWIEPIFKELRDEFGAREIKVQCHILEGDPKTTLLRQAEKWDVDCIYLGARGVDHGDRLYLGTVASAICTRARCSVEIVREPAKPESHGDQETA